MNLEWLEALRPFAEFAAGTIFGLLISTLLRYIDARIELTRSVLTEVEREEKPRRTGFLQGDKMIPVVTVLVMVAMLLAGLSWIRSGQENADQDKRDCQRARMTAQVLRERTKNYTEAARAEKRLWSNLYGFLDNSIPPDSPLLVSINRYRERQADYLEHLESNPYPKAGEC